MITKADLKDWSFLLDQLEKLSGKIKRLRLQYEDDSYLEYKIRRCEVDRSVLIQEIDRIENAVEALPAVERKMIILRYRENCSWQKIALELSFSCEYVRGRLHKRALSLLKDL